MTVAASNRARAGWLGAGVDLLACAGIVSAVYVPNAAFMAGRIFAADGFFHWNHFAVAPTLAYRSGLALGSDVYSQYGAGWPVLLAALGQLIPLSHQTILQAGVIYGCSYYLGLYALLRSAAPSRLLAAAGVLLALGTSLHSPLFATAGAYGIWQWPSLSPLRSPLDVWFLLLLLAHARSGRPVWSLGAGVLVGLALFLETDGGLLLAGTFAVYWVCLALSNLPVQRPGQSAALGALAAVLGLAAGLGVSSRGALFVEPVAFLGGWIGGVANSSAGGVGAIHFNAFLRDNAQILPWFFAALGSCLLAVGHTLERVLHGRVRPLSLLAGCVGLYGAGKLTLFAWRSYPIRLVLVAVPIAILAVLTASALQQALQGRLAPGRSSRWRARLAALNPAALPGLLVLALCAWLAANPVFQRYPSVWSDAGKRQGHFYLIPERREVAGVSARDRRQFGWIRDAIERVRELSAAGQTVAVLDELKTLIYLEAGVRPWHGDASFYMNTWTLEQQAALAARLEARRPDVVLIAAKRPSQAKVRDTREAFHRVLERHYRLTETLGLFEVWRCQGCAPDPLR